MKIKLNILKKSIKMKISNNVFRLLILILLLGADFCVLQCFHQYRQQVNLNKIEKADKEMIFLVRNCDTKRLHNIAVDRNLRAELIKIEDSDKNEFRKKIL